MCFMSDGENPILVFEQKDGSRDILHEVYYRQLLSRATEWKLFLEQRLPKKAKSSWMSYSKP